MKILLDENLPQQMRLELTGHDVFTAAYMGWSGVQNGALLQRAADAGFEAVITNDRGFEFEQNLSALPVAVILLIVPTNKLESMRLLYAAIVDALNRIRPCEFVRIELP